MKKLRREADLEQLLSETVYREIYGAHVYIQIPNFACLGEPPLDCLDWRTDSTIEKGHGRLTSRMIQVSTELNDFLVLVE